MKNAHCRLKCQSKAKQRQCKVKFNIKLYSEETMNTQMMQQGAIVKL